MFAAAAVAAAAALTAISTTASTTPQHNTQLEPGSSSSALLNPQQQSAQPRPYLSWTQYANQRRSSLQRRKFEITKRLEKATNAASNRKEYNIEQFQSKSLIEEKKQLAQKDKVKSSFNHQGFFTDPNSCLLENEDLWLRELSANVCSEFLRMHKSSQKPNIDEIDLTSHPTYKNFDLITNLQAEFGDRGQFDMNEISQALLEYLHVQDFTGQDSAEQDNSFGARNNYMLKQESIKKKREEKLSYILAHRWDPRWLKSIRNTYCIPFAIVTLIFLIFTNVSSNWIRFDGNL